MQGMKLAYLLASDFSGIGTFLLLFLVVVTVVGTTMLVLSATVGRRRWWGLFLAATPVAAGIGIAIPVTIAECDLPTYLILVAPELLLGIISIILWSLPRQ
ncbi:MAG TPA: hypothetical protein VFE46_08250 [Pirellulales bacterium]|jgi:hypothetical protein|nr:hypothetical protein [Pirellulales bacterium]